jgi:hypothetical protein
VTDTVVSDNDCRTGNYVRVRIRSTFSPVTPLVSIFGSHTFESYSRARIVFEFR